MKVEVDSEKASEVTAQGEGGLLINIKQEILDDAPIESENKAEAHFDMKENSHQKQKDDANEGSFVVISSLL